MRSELTLDSKRYLAARDEDADDAGTEEDGDADADERNDVEDHLDDAQQIGVVASDVGQQVQQFVRNPVSEEVEEHEAGGRYQS